MILCVCARAVCGTAANSDGILMVNRTMHKNDLLESPKSSCARTIGFGNGNKSRPRTENLGDFVKVSNSIDGFVLDRTSPDLAGMHCSLMETSSL